MSEQHHSISYVEFPATDLDSTIEFYSAVFGWKFTRWGDDYVSFDGSGISGGFRSDGEVACEKTGALVVIYSNDLVATESAIIAAGGQVTVPIFEFPGGRRFQFQDPTGNELAVWSE